MKWKEIFGILSDAQRKDAATALKAVNEENAAAPAQSNKQQVVVVSRADVRKSTAQMYVDRGVEAAKKYAAQRNAEQRKQTAGGAG